MKLDTLRKNIGITISKTRKRKGVTQVQLSASTGLGQSVISQIEQGTGGHMGTLLAIAVALRLPLSKIILEAEKIST
jgi:transcriptional regulator with XRE-family HTH domain